MQHLEDEKAAFKAGHTVPDNHVTETWFTNVGCCVEVLFDDGHAWVRLPVGHVVDGTYTRRKSHPGDVVTIDTGRHEVRLYEQTRMGTRCECGAPWDAAHSRYACAR